MQTRIERAKRLFMLGTLPFIVGGAAHAVLAVAELVGPFLLAPTDLAVRGLMGETPIRLTMALRLDTPIGATDTASVWRGYVGFNLTHSAGLLFFGLALFLLARTDYNFVLRTRFIVPLAVGFSIIYFLISLGFFFYLPTFAVALGAALFLVSAMMPGGVGATERGME